MIGGMDRELTEWLRRGAALVDGATLDYVAIHYRAGAKSWPEHATVRVDDRPIDDVIADVIGHVSDIVESGSAEGREGAVPVRLKLVRAKTPAGSRTFRPAGSVLGSDPERDSTDDDSPKGAMVATIHELRLLVGAISSELAGQSTNGWKLANELAAQNSKLTMALAESRAEGKYALAAPPQDDVTRMALELLPKLPELLGNLATLAQVRAQIKEQG